MRLFNPFLLRRFVKSNESIARSLERIANELCHTPVIADGGDDGVDITYSTDRSTWEIQQRDARRTQES